MLKYYDAVLMNLLRTALLLRVVNHYLEPQLQQLILVSTQVRYLVFHM